MTGLDETLRAIEREKTLVELQARRFVQGIALELLRRIVLKTPVDEGRARMNWNIGVGAPDLSTTDSTSKTGHSSVLRGMAALAAFRLGDIIYITNNLPYIRVLEFGEYPNPVKRGSWVKGVGWVKKSEGGFSKQAPVGMVGVTVAEINQIVPAMSAAMGLTGTRHD